MKITKGIKLFMVLVLVNIITGPVLFAANDESSELVWSGDECGCVPEMPWVSYAFYKSEPETEPAIIDFSVFSRIGYVYLSPDEDGDFKELKHWEEKKFKKTAERYETEIDLVVDISHTAEGKEIELDKDFILYELVSNIVKLVINYRGKGIDIDCSEIPAKFEGRVHLFMQLLKKRLNSKMENCQLNIILPYKFNHSPSPLDKEIIEDLDEYVDFFLIKMKNGKNIAGNTEEIKNEISVADEHKGLFEKVKTILTGKKDGLVEKVDNEKGKVEKMTKKVMDFILMRKSDPEVEKILSKIESTEKTELGEKEINIIAKSVIDARLRKKIIPVIMFSDANEDFENEYDLIIKVGFGGVGLWGMMDEADKNLEVLKNKFVLDEDSADFVKWLIAQYFPSVCKEVCPSRILYRTIFLVISGIFFAVFILSNLICEVRAFMKRFFWIYLTIGIILLIFFEILCLCDPVMQGRRTEITLGLFILVFIYGAYKLYQKKKEAEFP